MPTLLNLIRQRSPITMIHSQSQHKVWPHTYVIYEGVSYSFQKDNKFNSQNLKRLRMYLDELIIIG